MLPSACRLSPYLSCSWESEISHIEPYQFSHDEVLLDRWYSGPLHRFVRIWAVFGFVQLKIKYIWENWTATIPALVFSNTTEGKPADTHDNPSNRMLESSLATMTFGTSMLRPILSSLFDSYSKSIERVDPQCVDRRFAQSHSSIHIVECPKHEKKKRIWFWLLLFVVSLTMRSTTNWSLVQFASTFR